MPLPDGYLPEPRPALLAVALISKRLMSSSASPHHQRSSLRAGWATPLVAVVARYKLDSTLVAFDGLNQQALLVGCLGRLG
jgi:hypothetical protein